MKKLITAIFFVWSSSLFAFGYLIDTINIKSIELNEIRQIIVFKPIGIEDLDSVSIIYLLDGEFSQQRFEKAVEEQKENSIIGVGIINTNRNRDMLPLKQPINFLNFIEKELIPMVEKELLIKERILFGHSFAGGFTINSMLNRPGLFDKYIASSPTPIMDFIEVEKYKQLDSVMTHKIKFYFSYGSKDMKQVKKWGKKLKNNLDTQKLNRIVWINEIYDGENHNTSDIISLQKGLKF